MQSKSKKKRLSLLEIMEKESIREELKMLSHLKNPLKTPKK